MYLNHTFARKTFAQRNHFTFGLRRYLDRTFAQRIGSAKVKSKSHPMSGWVMFAYICKRTEEKNTNTRSKNKNRQIDRQRIYS